LLQSKKLFTPAIQAQGYVFRQSHFEKNRRRGKFAPLVGFSHFAERDARDRHLAKLGEEFVGHTAV